MVINNLVELCGLKPAASVQAADFNPRGQWLGNQLEIPALQGAVWQCLLLYLQWPEADGAHFEAAAVENVHRRAATAAAVA